MRQGDRIELDGLTDALWRQTEEAIANPGALSRVEGEVEDAESAGGELGQTFTFKDPRLSGLGPFQKGADMAGVHEALAGANIKNPAEFINNRTKPREFFLS